MVDIPVSLTESLKKGECVLFVGAGLSKGLPQWKDLIKPLAEELGVSTKNDPRIIASWYENKFGRKTLEENIVSQLQKDVPLPKSHTILARLPLKAIITTNYDNLLERALSKRKVTKIIYDKQAPFAGADQIQLIKMHGDIEDPSTIVITKKDYDQYSENHKALVTHLLGLLISSNLLFVGFSLEDPNFDHIYMQIKSLFGESKRKSYAIFKNPPEFEVERLKEEIGIQVIPIADYDEIPDIFEKLVTVCRPGIKTELTPSELEHVQNTFCEIVERQNKWLDPRGIFQFEKMLTKKDVDLQDVYVVPRLVRQEPVRKPKREITEITEARKDKTVAKEDKGKEMTVKEKEIKVMEKIEEMEEYTFEKQIEQTIKEVLSNPKNNHLVILGDPGVGKTCLLRYTALMASTNSGESLGIKKAVLPVLIPLGEYPHFGQKKMLREFIFHYIRKRICALPEDVLEYFLEKNVFFFLLDGLDEVVSESERIQTSKQVEQFMAQYPSTRIILTSRPVGYKAARLIGAIPHFTLAEFNDDEIKEFLIKWFTFLGKVEEESEMKAEEKSNKLAEIILKRERILRLARNPLLLTILVLIHRVGKKLPERRAEFYEYAVRTTAGTWDIWKRLHTDRKIPDQDVILRILEKIGFKLHKKPENTVETETLRTWLKEAMNEELGHSMREEINDFLWMLNKRAGLLTERGLNFYGFVHLTFQEYFAARYIALGRGTHLAQEIIKSHLYSSRWREVFLLAASVAPPQQADPLFESILEAENDFEKYIHSNLLFAGEALGDQPRLSESKRKEIIDRLICLTGVDHVDLLRGDAIEVLMKVRKAFQLEDSWGLELLKDEDWYVRRQAVGYFAAVGAADAEVKEKFFELLKDEDSDVREQAVKYLSKYAREESSKRAPTLFTTGDESTKREAYKLMKALLTTQ
ncbi:MAG: SIR2 family protein [Theionarchaea archaeon]|nr:SIR2 family protein [Theionarchaea archaeon]